MAFQARSDLHVQLPKGANWRTGSPKPIPRVLDVTKGQLCYIIGTVYMDMPLKPNILQDLARDVRGLFAPRQQLLTLPYDQALDTCPPTTHKNTLSG